MTPEQLVATQWIDQIHNHIVLPHATVSTCSNGGRMIDYAVISRVLAKNVELNVDLEAPFAPHSSLCLKLHMSISHVTMTTQLKPPAMPWKPEQTSPLSVQTKSGVELSQSSRFVPVSSRHVLC